MLRRRGLFSLARGVFGATPEVCLRRRRGLFSLARGNIRRNAEGLIAPQAGLFSLARGVFGATPEVCLRRRRGCSRWRGACSA